MLSAKFLALACLGSFFIPALCQDPWWSGTVIYQIYPRSFQDSDDNGVGDLRGIQSRLDHFVDLGVETIWLSPIYKSPMADNGYDISDFRDIDPLFGTMEDFEELVADVHGRGMRIIMDFVPNHSSDEHQWFINSVQRIDPYTDYYVWLDPSGFADDGTPLPPNNWVSIFRGPAWEYVEERGQFYYHNFAIKQPDLNYANPLVQQEMNDVLIYWLEKGVDGFRFDAILWIWEDQDFLDEPLSNNGVTDPNDYGYLDHVYTYNLPETRDILKVTYDTIKAFSPDKMNMLEAYLPAGEQAELYECSDFPFNFAFVEMYAPVTASKVSREVNDWLTYLPQGREANWVLGNHDNWRMGNRVGFDLIDAFNIIALSLPGITVTYQGDEIGMVNNMDISYEDTVDVQGCNCGPDRYLEELCSRDPERTPMQWSSAINAGFTSPGVTPWLPINVNYVDVNVDAENANGGSSIALYRVMVTLRNNEPSFQFGQAVLREYNGDSVLAIGRVKISEFDATFVTLVNFGSQQESVDIMGDFDPEIQQGLAQISTSGSAGAIWDLTSIVIMPKETLVLRLIDLEKQQ